MEPLQNIKGTHSKYSEDDVTRYRFSERQLNLSSDHVTVVSGRGAVDHDPVAVEQLLDFKISIEFLGLKTKHELQILFSDKT